jgi:hypothetical protein
MQDTKVIWNAGGQALAIDKTFSVEGYIYGDMQAQITAQMVALQNALSIQNQTLVLLQDTGAPSATLLTPAGAISGVQVHGGPSFPRYQGAEYATYRWFTATFYASYPFGNARAFLMDFHEQVEVWGGPSKYASRESITPGGGQVQMVYAATNFHCRQSGEAIGYLSYPPTAPPLFSIPTLVPPKISRRSPRRRSTGSYQEFPITWEFEWASPGPLQVATIVPNLWV